jgi:putative phosphoribosyl transferase
MSAALFQDRRDAGRRLAAVLAHLKAERPLVLALPRGGVAVAVEVARALAAPLDLLFARKIGHPANPEAAIGAIAEGSPPEAVLLLPPFAGRPDVQRYATAEAERQLAEIARRRTAYLGTRERPALAGHTAIVVDDGIATGATMMAALQAVRRQRPDRVVVAVPVAPADTLALLGGQVDDLVCLASPEPFLAVGPYYRRFDQLSDDDVAALLREGAAAA